MMNKKLIVLAAVAVVGLCAANSLIALRQAQKEKEKREAAAALASDRGSEAAEA
ncbi:MAG: hypothetical protein IKI02_06665 [Oscillospiraceae bacterium]|nr:hypothetical protein [Oscillospiraceae bacterium]